MWVWTGEPCGLHHIWGWWKESDCVNNHWRGEATVETSHRTGSPGLGYSRGRLSGQKTQIIHHQGVQEKCVFSPLVLLLHHLCFFLGKCSLDCFCFCSSLDSSRTCKWSRTVSWCPGRWILWWGWATSADVGQLSRLARPHGLDWTHSEWILCLIRRRGKSPQGFLQWWFLIWAIYCRQLPRAASCQEWQWHKHFAPPSH